LEELMELSDVITLHVPLTRETEGMINTAFIRGCRKNIFLLNLSRGKAVNLKDLVQSMKEGEVIACALDVLENEHLSTMSEEEKHIFDFLIKSSRTVLTPHIGGWTRESYEKISTVLLQKIKQLKR
jgi:D-3-phosphoglycerate dehydrogenase